ncbi:hypothetical protein UACE39S_06778 [Ureibacillus acetophenoni]
MVTYTNYCRFGYLLCDKNEDGVTLYSEDLDDLKCVKQVESALLDVDGLEDVTSDYEDLMFLMF